MPPKRQLCPHGNVGDCHDCLRNRLETIQQWLALDEGKFVMDDRARLENAQKNIASGIDRVRGIEQQEVHNLDEAEEPPFLSPVRERSPRPNFQPNRVVSSAFAENPIASAVLESPQRPRYTAPPSRQSLNSPQRPVTINVNQRKRWTQEQANTLIEAYAKEGSKWEVIRRTYPNLYEFTGVMLKDKYRHLIGRE